VQGEGEVRQAVRLLAGRGVDFVSRDAGV
jgi:hypothetical protein